MRAAIVMLLGCSYLAEPHAWHPSAGEFDPTMSCPSIAWPIVDVLVAIPSLVAGPLLLAQTGETSEPKTSASSGINRPALGFGIAFTAIGLATAASAFHGFTGHAACTRELAP